MKILKGIVYVLWWIFAIAFAFFIVLLWALVFIVVVIAI